ncbi:MAG: hypothetical protein MHM6MM_009264 [Cercozoa sp. M6MM]
MGKQAASIFDDKELHLKLDDVTDAELSDWGITRDVLVQWREAADKFGKEAKGYSFDEVRREKCMEYLQPIRAWHCEYLKKAATDANMDPRLVYDYGIKLESPIESDADIYDTYALDFCADKGFDELWAIHKPLRDANVRAKKLLCYVYDLPFFPGSFEDGADVHRVQTEGEVKAAVYEATTFKPMSHSRAEKLTWLELGVDLDAVYYTPPSATQEAFNEAYVDGDITPYVDLGEGFKYKARDVRQLCARLCEEEGGLTQQAIDHVKSLEAKWGEKLLTGNEKVIAARPSKAERDAKEAAAYEAEQRVSKHNTVEFQATLKSLAQMYPALFEQAQAEYAEQAEAALTADEKQDVQELIVDKFFALVEEQEQTE